MLDDYGANAELKPGERRNLYGEQIRLEIIEFPINQIPISTDYSTEFKDKVKNWFEDIQEKFFAQIKKTSNSN